VTETEVAPPKERARSSPRRMFAEYGVILIVALAVAFLLQAFVVKPYRIPSSSMVPTLDPHDRVLVARFLYRFTSPAHGDIVVFKYPLDTRVVFIKRLIGLPGDTLSLREGHVYRNGVELHEPYVVKVGDETAPTLPATPVDGSTMSEPWSLNRPYTVPPHTYFMMGDNRIDSDDSRVWGPVPARDLIGKAFLIYWPLDRIGVP
jgi:signal peptidase I